MMLYNGTVGKEVKKTVKMMEKIINGYMYRCLHCGAFIEYSDIDDEYICEECGKKSEFNDLVCFDFTDFCDLLSDETLENLIDELNCGGEWKL